ncbi:hypothetical protein A2V49_04815 [candidate division WWE3 bacterium RBG_19FT_COMBO_34_6]|uniref:Uncharacterized protein n=1 Tax=candidate division WWE3 bacterium RBG_19FT_COMBO_34_6 TaxID=1802612 RepID=A0A1F4UKU3_UNCKA|nr:MAG: hypothetical protein A2V49_04815 [candidate division WWE3 bacterium RBG_19FT_COMBO_34_6]
MKKVLIYISVLLIFLKINTYAQVETLPKLGIPSDRISSISSSNFGLIAGEYDPRLWNNPSNKYM